MYYAHYVYRYGKEIVFPFMYLKEVLYVKKKQMLHNLMYIYIYIHKYIIQN